MSDLAGLSADEIHELRATIDDDLNKYPNYQTKNIFHNRTSEDENTLLS